MKHTIITISLLLAACGTHYDPGFVTQPTVSESPATASQCPSGGIVIVVDNGTPQAICNGIAGAVGQTGATGPQGPQGNPGPQGTPGVDITPITWVQFCAPTTAYPNTFSEGGFCIAGNLYAVYSINGGFMTLIPPGVYSSNGVNSTCTFTVQANCVVTH